MTKLEALAKLREFRTLVSGQREYLEAVHEELPDRVDKETAINALTWALEERWPHEQYQDLIHQTLAAFDLVRQDILPESEIGPHVIDKILAILRLEDV